jgi:hypothetical protein
MFVIPELIRQLTRGDVHPELPKANLFHMGGWGKGAASVEEANILHALILICKPVRIIETGTENGFTAAYMGHACKSNGFGHVTTLEKHHDQAEEARANIREVDLQDWITVEEADSWEYLPKPNVWDFALLDTAIGMRPRELEMILPWMPSGAVIAIHDTSPIHPCRGEYMILEDIKHLGLHTINLPSPRGLTILQKP